MNPHKKDQKCKKEGCASIALSLSDHCWDHIKDKGAYVSGLIDRATKEGSLKGFNLQKVVMRDIHLTKVDFQGANLSQADLANSCLCDSNFERADMIGANLRNSDLTNSDFKNADLANAHLPDARLWNANFINANLSEADLGGADLWNARFFNAKLWHTNFTHAKSLTKRNFSGLKKGVLQSDFTRINENGPFSAEESYRNIKKYFLADGMYDDASWASFKEKTMERIILKRKKDPGYFLSLLMNILCGYGEKPSRIILSALATIMFYAAVYSCLNAIESSALEKELLGWVDYIYYSAITFTTVGYGDILPRPFPLFKILAASEAFTGTFLTGLFIFTLARKYSAR